MLCLRDFHKLADILNISCNKGVANTDRHIATKEYVSWSEVLKYWITYSVGNL